MTDEPRFTFDGSVTPLVAGGIYLLVYRWGTLSSQSVQQLIKHFGTKGIVVVAVPSHDPESVRILPNGTVHERTGTVPDDITK